MAKITAQLTYSVTSIDDETEEAYISDHGFYESGGWQYSIADESFQAGCRLHGRKQTLAAMTPERIELADVAEAVALVEEYGAREPSDQPGTVSFYQVDPSYDRAYFEKGDDTRICVHISCDDPAMLGEIVAEVEGN